MHAHIHAEAYTHSTNEDGNLSLSLLSSLSISLPPAVTQSKKFEALSFILSQSWTVLDSQAIKHKVNSYHHFSPSVLLFRTPCPFLAILLFISSHFN